MQKPKRLFTQDQSEIPNKLWEEVRKKIQKPIAQICKVMLDENLSWHEYLGLVQSEINLTAVLAKCERLYRSNTKKRRVK